MTQSAEREELRSVVRQLLSTHSSESHVRTFMSARSGYDVTSWKLMADQVGVQALAIPEEYGGAGFGFGELAIALEEAGRALLCAPLFSTCVLAANAILVAQDHEAAKQYLPRIASGECIATLALAEEDGQHTPESIRTRADLDESGHTLSGRKSFVLDGADADLILVAARSDKGISLFAVDRSADGISVEELATLDQTRNLAHITFDKTPARLLGSAGDGWSYVENTLDAAAAGLAAEQVGAASQVLEATVEYAKMREQFGRPIGSFQAIKHKLADMLVELESAKSAAQYACAAIESDAEDRSVAASIAKAYCSEAFYHIAAESIQIHGGIGFTWEHPAHLYFKRARGSQTMYGSPGFHKERIATLVGL